MPCSNTLARQRGQSPTGSWSEKSTGSSSSPPSDWPKSNSSFQSGCTSFRIAANGRPILLRKPCSGPIVLSRIS